MIRSMVFRSIFFRSMLGTLLAVAIAIPALPAQAQEQEKDAGQNKHLDIQSSAGDLHVGTDGDARKAGLPLYPGARPKRDDKDSSALNFGVLGEAFGMKLVVAKYESNDAPGKVIDYYRERLKKYGKVIECHTHDDDGDAHAEINDHSHSAELKCEGDNTGPVTELKVGTEDNQHVVAVKPSEGSGSTFALVYLHTRGKQGDI
jgi:hypothetical protein